MIRMTSLLGLFFMMSTAAYAQPLSTSIVDVQPAAYHMTVTVWATALNTTSSTGTTWIGSMPGNGMSDPYHYNGSRDTIIHIPSRFDRARPDIEIVVFFHGLGGFGSRDFETRTLRHIDDMYSQGRNVIFIIPECPWSRNTMTPRSRQRQMLHRPGEGETFMSMSLEILRQYKIPVDRIQASDITVIGHSAGGSAIAGIAKAGDLNIWEPGMIIFSDASYGTWADLVWKYYAKDHPHTEMYLLTRRGDTPYLKATKLLQRDRRAAKQINHVVLDRRLWTHGRIGDNCVQYPAGSVWKNL